jgi:U3 small nucleolar RNA-associated protein 12
LGTKAGTLEIFDIAAAELIQVVDAHGGAVWSLAPMPDGSGFVSGGADHDVKFWEYQLVQSTDKSSKHLSVRNTRLLRMTDDVLCVRTSPDAKYIAVALLDSTIKVFFSDSLKFFVSLYGHKLPVLTMDISSDGALLASGSADKNLKIWGMDFGDCHRSLFAHGDSVMAVQFVPKTHYIFSAGKDGVLKYWDADKFELLLTLEGHHAEVWCLAVSPYGDFVVTGSHDRSIRRWDRTEEPFFIEEEREKRLESMFEAVQDDSKDESLQQTTEVGAKHTQESLTAADSIIEALDMAEEEIERMRLHKNQAMGS